MELLETDSKSGSMILKCYLIIEIALFIVSEIILRIMGSELIGAVRYCAVVRIGRSADQSRGLKIHHEHQLLAGIAGGSGNDSADTSL